MSVSLSDLKDAFRYNCDTGELFHNENRSISSFLDERSYKIWRTKYAGSMAGNMGAYGYLQVDLRINGVRHHLKVHKVAYAIAYDDKYSGVFVDHINGIRDDNRKSNLRKANHSINLRNTCRKVGASGYRGVTLHHTGKYRAVGHKDGKQVNLGLYTSAKDAHDAYSKFAFGHGSTLRHIYGSNEG